MSEQVERLRCPDCGNIDRAKLVTTIIGSGPNSKNEYKCLVCEKRFVADKRSQHEQPVGRWGE